MKIIAPFCISLAVQLTLKLPVYHCSVQNMPLSIQIQELPTQMISLSASPCSANRTHNTLTQTTTVEHAVNEPSN